MKKQNGFTLVELMVTVAIIGIIAGLAYPAYQGYMEKSRRSDARVALLRMADAQERFYLQNNTYSANVNDVGGTATDSQYYTLAVTAADANTFTLTATPVATGPQAHDAACPDLILDSAGLKTSSGVGPCWK